MFSHKLWTKPSRLIKLFAVSSFIAICMVFTLFGWFFFDFLSQHLMQRDAEVSHEFVQSVSQIHQPESYFLGPDLPGSHNHLKQFYEHIVQMRDVIRTNIYSAEGVVLWSSEFALIGQRFDDNVQLYASLNGQLSVKWESVDEFVKEEHVAFDNDVNGIVEIYIPIWNSMRTAILGSVEIYKIPTALLQIITQGRWLFLLAALLGGVLFYLAMFWVVRYANTLLTQQQQALMQADKLAALGEMAAVVSHSLRGPLSNIRATAELAQLDLQEFESQQINARNAEQQKAAPTMLQGYMSDIMAEADRLGHWVRELLVSVHSQDEQISRTEIAVTLADSLRYCQQCITRTGVNVIRELPKHLPAVRTNPEFLKHVLIDLIANALEAMPQGGQLTIKAEQAGSFVALYLIDTGVGMSPEQLAQIFRPLHSDKADGLGVGLGLARRILQRYGGKLELFSQGEGNGSIALVQLPIAK